jgi:hypothetical protein
MSEHVIPPLGFVIYYIINIVINFHTPAMLLKLDGLSLLAVISFPTTIMAGLP